jgi:hypothetical protein
MREIMTSGEKTGGLIWSDYRLASIVLQVIDGAGRLLILLKEDFLNFLPRARGT